VLLRMLRPGLHSVAEAGPGLLAQAARHKQPGLRYTAIAPQHDPEGWASAVVATEIEQMAQSDWQHLAASQAWIFPDTLERLRDPWSVLRRIRALATGQVEVLACVANGQHWMLQGALAGGTLRPQEGGIPGRAPMHWFTRSALIEMFRECGFLVAEMVTVNQAPPPPDTAAALRALAAASGADPAQAEADAIPYQYIVRAIAA
jgi:hypothetical protein